MIVKVALKIPFSSPFDYKIPDSLVNDITPGKRLIVPLGNRTVSGVAVTICEKSEFKKLKSVIQVVDQEPVFDSEMLKFTNWISNYYLTSWGDILDAAIPSGLNLKFKKIISLNKETNAWDQLSHKTKELLIKTSGKEYSKIKLNDQEKIEFEAAQKNSIVNLISVYSGKQREREKISILSLSEKADQVKTRRGSKGAKILELLFQKKELEKEVILDLISNSRQPIKKLIEADAIKEEFREVEENNIFKPIISTNFLNLNQEQELAFNEIKNSLNSKSYQSFLLFGVTGSGKTEIYLHAVKQTIEQGKTALILIPEISLTPQLVSRFRNRFGEAVAVLHSGMSDKDRFEQWWKIKDKKRSIVIGTRSAIFAPLNNIGLIIVDEEHDGSYKQGENPHYNARDLAVKRAYDNSATVVLGSATPSAESFENYNQGKYKLLSLTKRANQATMPETEIINLKTTTRSPGVFYLSRKLVKNLKENYESGKQAIIFLNRRGFSSYLSCKSCNTVVLCKHCSIAMTWHKNREELVCHYCGLRKNLPLTCDECGDNYFNEEGFGTQRVERDLQLLFTKASFLRLDRDTLRKPGDLEEKIELIQNNKVDFIIGTQLLSKGHDFPNIGLVCAILADMSLNIPDFRSSERTFQLLSQVSGRAGRGEAGGGKTVFQAFNPEHYSLVQAKEHNFAAFIKKELELRKILFNPPFSKQALIKLSSENEQAVASEAKRLGNFISQENKSNLIQLLGPIEAPIYKVNKRYYWIILLKSGSGTEIKKICRRLFIGQSPWRPKKQVRLNLDIDPYSTV